MTISPHVRAAGVTNMRARDVASGARAGTTAASIGGRGSPGTYRDESRIGSTAAPYFSMSAKRVNVAPAGRVYIVEGFTGCRWLNRAVASRISFLIRDCVQNDPCTNGPFIMAKAVTVSSLPPVPGDMDTDEPDVVRQLLAEPKCSKCSVVMTTDEAIASYRYLRHMEHDDSYSCLCDGCICREVATAIRTGNPDHDEESARSCYGCGRYACAGCGRGCDCVGR
jgi:hypothetical protein